MPVGGIVVFDAAIAAFVRSAPVAQLLTRGGEAVTQEAKRLAPVSPAGGEDHASGELRSSIGYELGEDAEGLYVDVGTDVAYALAQELGAGPHVIEAHGDYPLRNRRTGQVFGRRVEHPGNPPQPFLRPALSEAAVGGVM